MRRALALVLVLLGFGGSLTSLGLQVVEAGSPHAALLTIDGAIDPISAGYLSRGIDVATEEGAQFVIVLLNTPGGLLSSTREMVEKVLTSDIPVIVYVFPPGAQAASAGTFLTASAHVAAMTPTSNIGAASPVGPGGEDLPETLKSKATEDAAAFMRSIAERRGRNADALEQTVLSAKSYSASEALEEGIIDLTAGDVEDLLAQVDGLTVAIEGGEVVLETEGLGIRSIDRTLVERFLGIVADPNIAFLLLSIGGFGILIEFFHPGLIVPGVAGVIALALALVALGNLEVSWVGLGLMGLAMVLFFLEMQAPGIGVFGITGAVSFVLGGFLLFGGFSPPAIPTPSYRVSQWVLGAVSGILFGFLLLFLRIVLQARRAESYPTTSESLVGQIGRATTPLNPRGTVQVASELWSAVSDSGEPIPEGEEVIVTNIEGLTLKVFKAPKGI